MTREEAIKVVRNIYQTDAEKEALETLIPELKESEDERIIKTLQEYVKTRNWNLGGPTQDEVLAWLEKQKHDRMKPIYDAMESFESALEKAWNDYHNGYEKVDKLEDDYVECAHAKGFREGYLFGIGKQKPSIDIDQLKSLMLQYLQEAANENDDSDIEADTDKWARKILGYGFEQKPVKCIEFENEFTNQVSHLLASVINKEWEYSKGFVEYATQSLLGHAKHEMKPITTNGIEEYRNEVEFNPKPGEKFWVRCKTEKKDNLWFEKGDERLVYTIQGKDGIMYVVCLDKDGKGNAVSYQNKEKFLETFDILESK